MSVQNPMDCWYHQTTLLSVQYLIGKFLRLSASGAYFFNPYNNEIWATSFGNGIRKGIEKIQTGVFQNDDKSISLSLYPNPHKIN